MRGNLEANFFNLYLAVHTIIKLIYCIDMLENSSVFNNIVARSSYHPDDVNVINLLTYI